MKLKSEEEKEYGRLYYLEIDEEDLLKLGGGIKYGLKGFPCKEGQIPMMIIGRKFPSDFGVREREMEFWDWLKREIKELKKKRWRWGLWDQKNTDRV